MTWRILFDAYIREEAGVGHSYWLKHTPDAHKVAFRRIWDRLGWGWGGALDERFPDPHARRAVSVALDRKRKKIRELTRFPERFVLHAMGLRCDSYEPTMKAMPTVPCCILRKGCGCSWRLPALLATTRALFLTRFSAVPPRS
eukprot:scaffold281525_cov32-Tisochrysis_lutea.AAC.5